MDTITLPPPWLPLGEEPVFAWSPEGNLVTGTSAGEPRIEGWWVSSKEMSQAPVWRFELDEVREPRDARGEGAPAIRALQVGEEGRIWVSLERSHWLVYERDGTYLGQVAEPEGFFGWVRRGDAIWGVRRDEHGVPAVVGDRIVWPTDRTAAQVALSVLTEEGQVLERRVSGLEARRIVVRR